MSNLYDAIGCEPRCTDIRVRGLQELVRDFHKKFGLRAPDEWAVPSRARMFARLNWIWDETDELNRAINDDDVIEILDALADIIYFCYGFAVECGAPPGLLDDVIAEVHDSNMRKEGGNTRLDGKLVKPPGWCPPDIAAVLAKHGIVQSQYGRKRDRTPTNAVERKDARTLSGRGGDPQDGANSGS